MNRTILTLFTAIVGHALGCLAQDDLYFTPSKKKAKQKVEAYADTEYDNWADHRSSNIDVDAYNRRGNSDTSEIQPLYEPENEAESLTNRIVRFHSPGITIVSSPYYTEYIDIYTDPWYSFYGPYSWYDYNWHTYYGWGHSWWWNSPYYWHAGWYTPHWGWHGHFHPIYHPNHPVWHPHHGGHHHYYPSRTEHRRPIASGRNHRPSTERGNRPSVTQRPRQERGNVSTNRTSTSTDRNFRKPSSSTVAPSRTERPQRVMSGGGGGGNRPQRTMGGSRNSGGRRR